MEFLNSVIQSCQDVHNYGSLKDPFKWLLSGHGLFTSAKVRKLETDKTIDPTKKVALFFRAMPNADESNALRHRFSDNTFVSIASRLEKKYAVVLRSVGSIDDMNKVINEIKAKGQKISQLWLSAHGDADRIFLSAENGQNELITQENIKNLNLNELEADASIYLDSCNTGKNYKAFHISIAEYFQFYAGSLRKVYAPNYFAEASNLNYSDLDEKLTFRFPWRADPEAHKTIKESFNNFFKPNRDVTADISFEKLIASGKVRKIEHYKPSFYDSHYPNEYTEKSIVSLSNFEIIGKMIEIFARSLLALTIASLCFDSYRSKFKILYDEIMTQKTERLTRYIASGEFVKNPELYSALN